MTIRAINKITDAYLLHYPSEADRMALFTVYLVGATPEGLFDRKNFKGHITTSAFIVNTAKEEMLLLRHKSLKRWLQPGGHVEGDDSLLQSAQREAEEETGISRAQLCHIPVIAENERIPFDIDSHYIPSNPKKNEEGHYHHDFRYLFVYTGDGAANYNEDESTGLKWVPFKELETDETFGGMVDKIRRQLN